jgi:hypothetical protein
VRRAVATLVVAAAWSALSLYALSLHFGLLGPVR